MSGRVDGAEDPPHEAVEDRLDDPFRCFDEWDGEADRRAYAALRRPAAEAALPSPAAWEGVSARSDDG